MNDVFDFLFNFLGSIINIVIIPDITVGEQTFTVTLGQFLISFTIIAVLLSLFIPKWRNT